MGLRQVLLINASRSDSYHMFKAPAAPDPIATANKDIKEDVLQKTNPLMNYKYYKKISLTHNNFEVSKAVFNHGILSIELIDKTEDKEKINTRVIEVTTAKEN